MPEQRSEATHPGRPLPPPTCAEAGTHVHTPLAPSLDFEQLYTEHFPFVWRSLRVLGVSGPALDDAAQDVFLVVHRRLPQFEARSSIRTWLFAIVQHVAFNHRRTVRRKLAPLTAFDETQLSSEPSPLERAQDRQTAEFLEKFLSGLRTEQRALFLLVLVEQMPVPEVAEALGIPLNTAYSRIRAMKQAFQKAAATRQERSL